MAAAQTRRYHYNRRVRVNLFWKPKEAFTAATDNMQIRINTGHPLVTKIKGREARYQIVCGMAGRTRTASILPHIPIDILRFVWYNKAEVRTMLIDSVVQKEAVRNEQMILQYESLIEALPKGSIACRKNGYYYLRYRENGKLCDKYIGKDTETVDTIREKLALRKHYTEMLSALRQEQKTIHKLLEELA